MDLNNLRVVGGREGLSVSDQSRPGRFGQSPGLSIKSLCDTNVCINSITVASPYYDIFCLLEGSLLGTRGEVSKL